MPSLFPGMDPYLESPDIWPDFQDGLASEIRRELNGILPRPYYTRLEMRPELGIVEEHVILHTEAIRHHFVEIRAATRGHKLITVIEIVRPSNKQAGRDRRAYQQKQQEVLDSDVSLLAASTPESEFMVRFATAR